MTVEASVQTFVNLSGRASERERREKLSQSIMAFLRLTHQPNTTLGTPLQGSVCYSQSSLFQIHSS